MTDPSPDLTEPLIGYRYWWLKDGVLTGVYPETWPEPVRHAVCRRFEEPGFADPPSHHAAPDPDCECGIYAFHAPGVFGSYPGEVWGIVALWGRIVAYRQGARAQHACIKAVASVHPAHTTPVRRVAGQLGVDSLSIAELPEASGRYGITIPSSLLPEVPRLAYRDLDLRPAFRFVYQSTGRLWVHPWGYGAEGLEEEVDVLGAVGDVFALDDDRAVAVFGYAGVDRARAARALLTWADEDDWRLGISPDDAPLARSANRDEGEAWCGRCGPETRDWKDRMKMAGRGYTSTRCWTCGGRLRWLR